MKSKILTVATGAVLIAGSAALYAMSATIYEADGDTAQVGRSMHAAAAPAFSVVVTSRRSMPGHSFAGTRSRQRMRSTEWTTSAQATGHGWGEVPTDPRS